MWGCSVKRPIETGRLGKDGKNITRSYPVLNHPVLVSLFSLQPQIPLLFEINRHLGGHTSGIHCCSHWGHIFFPIRCLMWTLSSELFILMSRLGFYFGLRHINLCKIAHVIGITIICQFGGCGESGTLGVRLKYTHMGRPSITWHHAHTFTQEASLARPIGLLE